MRRIEIYDTTLRDGTQGEGVSFSVEDKVLITKRLDALRFDYVEGGYPLSNPKDAEYFRRAADLSLDHAKVTAFGMTRRRGVRVEDDPGMRALVESKARAVALVGKTSDFQVEAVLRVSLEENLAMIAESVEFLRHHGLEVLYDAEHFFDGWKSNPEYAAKTLQAAAKAGARIAVLCDTNGGSMPEEIAELVKAAQQAVNIPVGIHCHNDCGVAVANSLAGIDAGAAQVQGTINGFGERCGNADLLSVAANLALKKKGYDLLQPESITKLTELSRYVYELANLNRRTNQPFVGESAFAHKGGMHVHAINRATSSYEHIAPEQVGNERRILVSELSGRSNIVALTSRHNLQHDQKLMDRILAEVVNRESQGYQYEAAEGSFNLLVKECAGTLKRHFQRLGYHVNVELDRHGEITTEATVKLQIGDVVRHEVAEGDGPVNALDNAMRKALLEQYPNLANMHLVDYKVRVINSEAATAAMVRVSIESGDSSEVWGTVGVSENVIEASWIALADSFEYKLQKDAEGSGTPTQPTQQTEQVASR